MSFPLCLLLCVFTCVSFPSLRLRVSLLPYNLHASVSRSASADIDRLEETRLLLKDIEEVRADKVRRSLQRKSDGGVFVLKVRRSFVCCIAPRLSFFLFCVPSLTTLRHSN